jgi:ribosomal protein S1
MDDPKSAVRKGDPILVKIMGIDPKRERVSLSMRRVPVSEQMEWMMDLEDVADTDLLDQSQDDTETKEQDSKGSAEIKEVIGESDVSESETEEAETQTTENQTDVKPEGEDNLELDQDQLTENVSIENEVMNEEDLAENDKGEVEDKQD